MIVFGYRVPMMASILVWCLVWEIVGQTGLMYLVPPFSSVLVAVVELVQLEKFQAATVTTLRSFASGIALAAVIGIALGVLMGRVKAADKLLGMWVNLFVSAPLSALVPVLMILSGMGERTIVVSVFLFAVWIIVLDTRAGVLHVSASLIDMGRSYGASRWQLYSPDPRRQRRGDRAVAGIHHRLWRAVRDLFAQLPDGRVLGADDPSIRLRHVGFGACSLFGKTH
jgi:NitT/TauT family transport system permease protein